MVHCRAAFVVAPSLHNSIQGRVHRQVSYVRRTPKSGMAVVASRHARSHVQRPRAPIEAPSSSDRAGLSPGLEALARSRMERQLHWLSAGAQRAAQKRGTAILASCSMLGASVMLGSRVAGEGTTYWYWRTAAAATTTFIFSQCTRTANLTVGILGPLGNCGSYQRTLGGACHIRAQSSLRGRSPYH